jgi:hypothetical protein
VTNRESEIVNENFRRTVNQDRTSGTPRYVVEEAAMELSLYARYLWDIASALSREELRNEFLAVRGLTKKLGEAIERSN